MPRPIGRSCRSPAAIIQSQGTKQGIFFDTKDMQPLANNEAFAEALRIYQESTKYAPPDEINLDVGDTRKLFTSGQCALTLDWGDIGPLAVDPSQSTVQDKVGAVIMPGSKRVLDWASGKLVDCDKDRCPYAIDGVNHAPFAAFGGWSGGINAKADDKVKDAAYAFLSLYEPAGAVECRRHHRQDRLQPLSRSRSSTSLDLWIKSGMSETAAKNYLGAIQDSLNSPNMVLDLRVPQNQRYEQVVLDTSVARMLAGELDIRRHHEGHHRWLERDHRRARPRQAARRL